MAFHPFYLREWLPCFRNWQKWVRLANFVPDNLNGWIAEFLVAIKCDPEL
jgi:hypothetical protein